MICVCVECECVSVNKRVSECVSVSVCMVWCVCGCVPVRGHQDVLDLPEELCLADDPTSDREGAVGPGRGSEGRLHLTHCVRAGPRWFVRAMIWRGGGGDAGGSAEASQPCGILAWSSQPTCPSPLTCRGVVIIDVVVDQQRDLLPAGTARGERPAEQRRRPAAGSGCQRREQCTAAGAAASARAGLVRRAAETSMQHLQHLTVRVALALHWPMGRGWCTGVVEGLRALVYNYHTLGWSTRRYTRIFNFESK